MIYGNKLSCYETHVHKIQDLSVLFDMFEMACKLVSVRGKRVVLFYIFILIAGPTGVLVPFLWLERTFQGWQRDQ